MQDLEGIRADAVGDIVRRAGQLWCWLCAPVRIHDGIYAFVILDGITEGGCAYSRADMLNGLDEAERRMKAWMGVRGVARRAAAYVAFCRVAKPVTTAAWAERINLTMGAPFVLLNEHGEPVKC